MLSHMRSRGQPAPIRKREDTARACNTHIQEAQLSQRDRAMLRVIEYFVKLLKVDHSIKVIQNDISSTA